jgi:hypothetical protein
MPERDAEQSAQKSRGANLGFFVAAKLESSFDQTDGPEVI